MPERKVLHSWKDISNYTGRGIRTIQRYEVTLGFPIRRVAGTPRAAVLAFSDEIDAWLSKAPSRATAPAVTSLSVPTADEIKQRTEWLAVAANAKRSRECAQTAYEHCQQQAKRVQEIMDRFEATRLKMHKLPQLNRFP